MDVKGFKFLVFFFILFISFDVFATNTNVSNKIKYDTSSSGGTYLGDEIYLGGYNGRFNVGQRYNGRLGYLSFYLSTNDYNFEYNHTYTITLNMATEDWRNNFMGPHVTWASSDGTLGSTITTSSFRFVSKKQIKFNFKVGGTLYPYIYFRLYSTDYGNPNGGNTAITGLNNWNLSSIYINDNVSATPTPAPVTPAPTPTPQPNNQDIINNNTQNTTDIINNNNSNTESIIENDTQNTTDIINNNNSNTENITNFINQSGENVVNAINDSLSNICTNKFNVSDFAPGTFINNTDTVHKQSDTDIYGYNPNSGYVSWNSYNSEWSGIYTSSKFQVISGLRYYLSFSLEGLNFSDIGFFAVKVNYYNYLGAFQYQELKGIYNNNEQIYFDIPWNTLFARVSIETQYPHVNILISHMYFTPTGNYCVFGSTSSKLDDTTDAINNVNNSLNNDNVDNGVGSSFFSDFSTSDNGGISAIVTKPLVIVNNLLSNNGLCTNLSLPEFMGVSNAYLPSGCILWNSASSTMISLWNIFVCGLGSYFILRDLFKTIEDLKNPDNDKVEVMDL